MENNKNEVELSKKNGGDAKLRLDKVWDKLPKTLSVKTAVIVAIIIILAVFAYFYKGLLVAATVNGYPISRLAVIQELEKTAGKNTLEALINKKLISDEAHKKGIEVNDGEVNAEIKKIEDQVKTQGQTLDQALITEGMKLDDLKGQIITQISLEKLVADKAQVSDEEVQQYIKNNNVTIPKEQESQFNDQIKNTLTQQKLNTAATDAIKSLRSQAKINYFVNY